MNSYKLFGSMPTDLAIDVLEYAFANDKKLYRTALDAVAQTRKVRSVFLERQPRLDRFLTMAATLSRPPLEVAATSLISAWLLKKHAPMLAAFLDALGVKHENGVVDDLPASMDDAALKSAVEGLLTQYPPPVVAVYLHAFNDMNEAKWANLQTLLETDPRLKLAA